jgi:PleD family two-component response regulator
MLRPQGGKPTEGHWPRHRRSLLSQIGEKAAAALAQTVRLLVLDLPMRHAETAPGAVSICFGVCAMIPQDGGGPADLLRAADRALYRAKLHVKSIVVTAS